mgnify:CR=1 FL=1
MVVQDLACIAFKNQDGIGRRRGRAKPSQDQAPRALGRLGSDSADTMISAKLPVSFRETTDAQDRCHCTGRANAAEKILPTCLESLNCQGFEPLRRRVSQD